jgi:prolipoprotein diacylglyceryl transferase
VTTTVLAYIPSPSQGVWHLDVFNLFEIPLRAYALFIIVGIVAALVLGDRRWEARGGQRGVIYDIALWAVPFGLIGGRLYHVITDWRTYFGDDGAGLAGALRIWDGGLGIWGAVALGGVGAWIGCRQHGIPLPAFGDAIAPGIVLAQAIGRLGNYFNQELYGRPTTLPWGLEIFERRDDSGALDSLNGVSTGQLVEVVHPTFLYELLWNVLVFAVLIWIDKRFKIGHGRLFAMYVAGYCLGRFWIELMRSDVATHIAGIRVNSFTSTFVFIGAVVYIMVAPKGREDPASLAGKPEQVGEDEDTVEAFAKELTAVAATTGVVAAAKVAGEAEDEDAKAAGDDKLLAAEDFEFDPEVEVEAEPEAEDEEADEEPEAEAEDETAEPEAEAEEAEAETEDEAAESEAETPAEDEEVEVEPEAEAEEPEAEAEEPEAEAEGAEAEPEAETPAEDEEVEEVEVEPEAEPEAEAEGAEDEAEEPEAEPQAEDEEAEPEDEAETEDKAEEGEAESEPEPEAESAEAEDPDAEDPEAEAEDEEAEDAEAEADELEDEAAEADETATEPETEAEVAEADDAPDAEDADKESDDDSEADESETEDAEAAVGAAEAEPSEEEAAAEEEAVAEEADSAAEVEPTTGVLDATPESEEKAEPVTPPEESGGRLSRWLRRRR